MSPLSQFISTAEAIALLFGGDVEVVIHDLQQDCIFHIANNLSGRKIGEDSLLRLSADDDLEADVIGPYEKAGPGGYPLRSITSVLRSETGKAIGLLCINADHSRHLAALETLQQLVAPEHTTRRPEVLFRHDWQQQIKDEIAKFLRQQGIGKDLDRSQRRELLASLDSKGLFYAKRSMEQLTSILKVSRATLYKDLSAIRKNKSVEMKL